MSEGRAQTVAQSEKSIFTNAFHISVQSEWLPYPYLPNLNPFLEQFPCQTSLPPGFKAGWLRTHRVVQQVDAAGKVTETGGEHMTHSKYRHFFSALIQSGMLIGPHHTHPIVTLQ